MTIFSAISWPHVKRAQESQWTNLALEEACLPTVLAYCSRRLPTRVDAEDATVETFLAASARLSACPKPPEEATAWLLGIARRKVADILRREQKRRRDLSLEHAQEVLYATATDQSLLQEEARQAVRALMATLRPEHREVLLLKYADELSLKQIACALGKSEAAISSLLQRARAAALKQGSEYFREGEST
ncbi:sigma-70 family RNA polymerase sigma factor [Armatimonas sp.]|uniref:RNA polymerase sigma factor n=1 Tax=Armatimonas sp. TaxID=1872638 RepID=UPI00286B07D3|nr:sigma-70 family RNA polymerase sigma factor [Armatimonas sp.]